MTMASIDTGASSSAGPSTPATPTLPADPSLKPTNTKKSTAHKHSTHHSDPALLLSSAASLWRDSLPVLASTEQAFVDTFLEDEKWQGPTFIYDDDQYASSEDDLNDCHRDNNSTPRVRRGGERPKTKNKGSRLFRLVKAYSNSLDNDEAHIAGIRLLHIFLRSILPSPEVLLLGTQFSAVLCPRCTCHSKRKASDGLQDALNSVGLSKVALGQRRSNESTQAETQCNPHGFNRVVFPVGANSRWFVALVTSGHVTLYDPVGQALREPDMVRHLCEQIADAFTADDVKRNRNATSRPKYQSHIVSPGATFVDPVHSATLACAAIEVLVHLPLIDAVLTRDIHLVLWFLSECAARGVSLDQFKRVLSTVYEQWSASFPPSSKNGTAKPPSDVTGQGSSQIRQADIVRACVSYSPAAAPTTDNVKPTPRVNAPKVPFKAKRRAKSKKVTNLARGSAPPASDGKFGELDRALVKLSKVKGTAPKIQDTLVQRLVFICKSGQLPGHEPEAEDLCQCYACSILGPFFL